LAIELLIVLAPISRFYSFGWGIRKQEFTNRLIGRPIDAYMNRFWKNTLSDRKSSSAAPTEPFSRVYDVIGGRQLYVVPAILFAFTLLLFGGLAISTGLRAGYEVYVSMYIGYKKTEGAVFASAIPHLPLGDINGAFYPFPAIALTFPTLAAVAGAYLNATQAVIRGYKGRTLLSSDLLWGAFRLVVAIPLGMAVGTIASAPLAPLVGFALGAFPITEINKLLRRLASRTLNDPTAAAANQDNLLNMRGVTPDIADLLNDEGIYSAQQLVDTDPVSLALRTGLSFDLVVNLISQSQVWSYMGDAASKLAAYGFCDARMIKRLMDAIATGDEVAIATRKSVTAAAGFTDEAMLTFVFKAIATDPYTEFLFGIS
jgi:hypothetical protein